MAFDDILDRLRQLPICGQPCLYSSPRVWCQLLLGHDGAHCCIQDRFSVEWE